MSISMDRMGGLGSVLVFQTHGMMLESVAMADVGDTQ